MLRRSLACNRFALVGCVRKANAAVGGCNGAQRIACVGTPPHLQRSIRTLRAMDPMALQAYAALQAKMRGPECCDYAMSKHAGSFLEQRKT
ncbi:MAG TPA: hypothetical protein VGU65_13210 [Frateuria sp.]|uniref:hypothetical protein n=1 Tax=Frateuria sp. TaxID=2211372 RepID=UPI002DF38850|nr:hypothetical protein [Frateuria sp.]